LADQLAGIDHREALDVLFAFQQIDHLGERRFAS